jgi:hypothetical protein
MVFSTDVELGSGTVVKSLATFMFGMENGRYLARRRIRESDWHAWLSTSFADI